ncbi:MAG: hypothetical protein JW809_00090 [Pirellulales bacterium]|nr:hypothetical protein [Pirellulales bacterium]
MSATPRDVDQIVREVLAQLGAAPEPGRTPAPATGPADAGPAGDVAGEPGHTVRATARVVTLADVGPRLGNARCLLVPPGAVVTPAVRDVLRDRGISLCFASVESPPGTAGGTLAMVVAVSSFDPAAVVEILRKSGLVVEPTRSACLIETCDRLAEAASRGGLLGVVLTPHVAAALCLANRLSGLRAVMAADPDQAVEAARAVGANVLVARPDGFAPYRLGQMIARFAAGAPYACPESLRGRLT